MSDSNIWDSIHLSSNKAFSVEDQPQKDSMIRPRGIANLHRAQLATFTIDWLKRGIFGL
jgi:hypothetical protein